MKRFAVLFLFTLTLGLIPVDLYANDRQQPMKEQSWGEAAKSYFETQVLVPTLNLLNEKYRPEGSEKALKSNSQEVPPTEPEALR